MLHATASDAERRSDELVDGAVAVIFVEVAFDPVKLPEPTEELIAIAKPSPKGLEGVVGGSVIAVETITDQPFRFLIEQETDEVKKIGAVRGKGSVAWEATGACRCRLRSRAFGGL